MASRNVPGWAEGAATTTDLDQLQFVSLERLDPADDQHRALKGLVDWKVLRRPLAELDNKGHVGADGYGIVQLFQMLL